MKVRPVRVIHWVLIVLIMLANSTALRADITGSILGVVHDRSQGVVAGAQIVAINIKTNLQQETESAADGSFRFLALPAGDYKLTVNAKGFRPFVENDVVVQVNDQLRLDRSYQAGLCRSPLQPRLSPSTARKGRGVSRRVRTSL